MKSFPTLILAAALVFLIAAYALLPFQGAPVSPADLVQ